jgi:hypothetical protein
MPAAIELNPIVKDSFDEAIVFSYPGYFRIISPITYIAKEDSRLEIKNSHSVLVLAVVVIVVASSETPSLERIRTGARQ